MIAVAEPRSTVPASIARSPVNAFVPASVSVPAPLLVSVPPPLNWPRLRSVPCWALKTTVWANEPIGLPSMSKTAAGPLSVMVAVVFVPPVFVRATFEVNRPPVTLRLPAAAPVAAVLPAIAKLPPGFTVKVPPPIEIVPVAVPVPPVPDFDPSTTELTVKLPVSNCTWPVALPVLVLLPRPNCRLPAVTVAVLPRRSRLPVNELPVAVPLLLPSTRLAVAATFPPIDTLPGPAAEEANASVPPTLPNPMLIVSAAITLVPVPSVTEGVVP